jgi:nitrogen fixation NifU-like protein
MTAMEQLYQQLILDHAKHPAHRGAQDAYDVEVHHVNPTCGDEVTLRVRLDAGDAGPVIGELTWTGQGCSISQASASVMSQAVSGRPVEAALALSDDFRELMDSRGVMPEKFAGDDLDEALEDAVAFVGVARYPARIKCALLGWAAMKDAVAQASAATDGEAR